MRMRQQVRGWLRTVVVCAMVGLLGLLGAFSAPGGRLEESLGLGWLFEMRGAREPPAGAVVVAIDGRGVGSPTSLDCAQGARRYPDRWPRRCHAALIEVLSDLGADVILYDIAFTDRGRPGEDARLAQAIRASGRVALLQPIEVTPVPGGGEKAALERLTQPLPRFAEAAVGLAPFPLPKVPVRVNQFWAFKTSLGDIPTLPALGLQVRDIELLPRFLEALARAGVADLPSGEALMSDGLPDMMRQLRRRLVGMEGLAARVDAVLARTGAAGSVRARLRALARLYAASESHYFNFHGPPGTMRTLRAERLLAQEPRDLPDLSGKAVFVGEARFGAADKDGFYTVFSQPDGVDLSGIELAATAFTNLAHESDLRPAPPWLTIAVVLGFGVMAGALSAWLPGIWATLGVAALAAAHVAGSLLAFAAQQLWLPLAVPVILQAPLAVVAGLLSQYVLARRQRRNAARAIGYYVPKDVADKLVQGAAPAPISELRYGVCLATDVQGYTTISQTMPPVELARYMNEYFETLVKEVERNGGFACQTVADSVMGVWMGGGPDDPAPCANACRAALALERAVDAFNARRDGPALRTRIGIHVGWMALGHVGGGGHFAYTVTGDTPNVASRLQELNKRLGTRILASAPAFAGSEVHCLARRVGSFVPRGKSERLTVMELLAPQADADPTTRQLRQDFEAALSVFESGDRPAAREAFQAVLAAHPGDGPSQYYLRKCGSHGASPTAGSERGAHI